jgi:hypothetical protein
MIFLRGFLVAAALSALLLAPAWSQDTLPELPPEGQPIAAEATARLTETVSVQLDLAAVVRIPAGTDTLALGNPSIADVTQPRAGSFAVVTGKSYGTTNLLALTRDGDVLHEMTIHVKAPENVNLTVLRGAARETWSCLPRCEPTATLGDNAEYFSGSAGQIGNRNGLAGGGGGEQR